MHYPSLGELTTQRRYKMSVVKVERLDHPHGANHRKKSKCAFVLTKEDCVPRCLCYGLYDVAYLDPSFWVIGIGSDAWAIKGITQRMQRATHSAVAYLHAQCLHQVDA